MTSMDDLKAKMADLETRAKAKRVEADETDPSDVDTVHRLMAEYEALVKEMEAVRSEIANSKEAPAPVPATSKQLDRLRNRFAKLTVRAENHKAKYDELLKELEDIRAEIEAAFFEA